MAVRTVEGDRTGTPVRVYHRFNRESWTHGYVAACPICRKAGEPVAYRRKVLAAYRRAARLAVATQRVAS